LTESWLDSTGAKKSSAMIAIALELLGESAQRFQAAILRLL
jgi:hypothetical protein